MTDLMEEAIETLRHIPTEYQDAVARVMMLLAGKHQPAYVLSPEEMADLDEADAEIARGDFASDDEMRAVWAMHGL